MNSSRLVRNASGMWTARDFVAPASSFAPDDHAALYRIEDNSFWFSHRNDCILAALEERSVNGPLLDVGGGNGVVSAALQKHGFSTVMLEPGFEGARNALARGLPEVACATLEEAGFEDGAFGAAGAFDVIEHVEDAPAILREIHRVLRPDGLLCVTVPAYEWLWSSEDVMAGHHRRYTLLSLHEELSRARFEVLQATYFFAPLVAPVFLLRSLPGRLFPGRSTTESAAKQHTPSRAGRALADAMLAPEVRRIRARRMIPFGSSCLAVARRAAS